MMTLFGRQLFLKTVAAISLISMLVMVILIILFVIIVVIFNPFATMICNRRYKYLRKIIAKRECVIIKDRDVLEIHSWCKERNIPIVDFYAISKLPKNIQQAIIYERGSLYAPVKYYFADANQAMLFKLTF